MPVWWPLGGYLCKHAGDHSVTTEACSSPHLTCLGVCGMAAWKLNGVICAMRGNGTSVSTWDLPAWIKRIYSPKTCSPLSFIPFVYEQICVKNRSLKQTKSACSNWKRASPNWYIKHWTYHIDFANRPAFLEASEYLHAATMSRSGSPDRHCKWYTSTEVLR